MDRLEEIVKRSRPVRRGDLIFRAGDKLINIYAVRSGTVKLSMLDESGADQILGFLFPGEIIGLDGIDKQVHQVSATAIEVTTYFLLTLSARFQALGFSAAEFRLSMSRQDIANYLGLTIETVSRVFSRLQRDDIIKIDRKMVTIQDRNALVSVSTSCQTAKKLTGHD
ncbi:MAG: helix-turn-helix domain-containing protein [Gammaproteobacteria bacterium]